ncbi:MAG: sodium/solute symporter [Planctomycetaceae bacterium]|nr:sodium/solute symporter [Planctomycetaceae bacterium]
MSLLDIFVFVGFTVFVIFVGIYMGQEKKGKEVGSESYFLAGRGLKWWLIGFSLIGANISTEQFVGMSGSAARTVGFAIVGYEWLAAVTLIIVAFFFLPTFLRCGIYTIPEFLENRFGKGSRLLMSLATIVILVGVNINAVIFSGAKMLDVSIDPLTLTQACWFVGIISAIYVIIGGLRACAWADLLHGGGLFLGGAIILCIGLYVFNQADVNKIAATPEMAQKIADMPLVEKFHTVHADRLHTIRPMSDDVVPWTVLLLGLWIPNLYYWGLNQFIMQRTLGAKSLAQGQGGIVFASFLKVLIPFIVIFPGMIALSLFKDNTLSYDVNMKTEAQYKSNILPAVVYETKTGHPLPSFDLKTMFGDGSATPDQKDQEEMKKGATAEFATAKQVVEDTVKNEQKVMFKFNDDFAGLFPEDSQMLMDYNMAVYKDVTGKTTEVAEKAVDEEYEKSVKSVSATLAHDKKDWNLGTGELTPAQRVRIKNQAILAKIKSDHNDKITGTGLAEMGYSIKSLFQSKDAGLVLTQKEFVGYDYDAAFPLLLRNLIKPMKYGINGFILAAMMGAVMSALASMLNAASTIFTMDIMKRYLTPKAPDKMLVFFGRVLIVIFTLLGCFMAPFFGDPRFGGIFSYIQEFQGFISPGILAIFVFGLFFRRSPGACGIVGMLIGPIVYGLLMFLLPQFAFLNRMAITFGIVFVILLAITLLFPRKEPFVFPQNTTLEMKSSKLALVLGVFIVAFVGFMYYVLR